MSDVRECGTCTMCCKTMGIYELDKRPGSWCPHAAPGSAQGCKVYDKRPETCRSFSCAWLDGHVHEDFRPDRIKAVLTVANVSGHTHPLEQKIQVRVNELPSAEDMVANSMLRRWLRRLVFQQGALVEVICSAQQTLRLYYPDGVMQEVPMQSWEDDQAARACGESFRYDSRPFTDWAHSRARVRDRSNPLAELTWFDVIVRQVEIIEESE